jgi:hypothetical protein
MSWFISPIQAVVVAAAVGWPLVAWSKTRAAARAGKGAEVDARLKGLYRTIELRGPPPFLATVIDNLEEQEAPRQQG